MLPCSHNMHVSDGTRHVDNCVEESDELRSRRQTWSTGGEESGTHCCSSLIPGINQQAAGEAQERRAKSRSSLTFLTYNRNRFYTELPSHRLFSLEGSPVSPANFLAKAAYFAHHVPGINLGG